MFVEKQIFTEKNTGNYPLRERDLVHKQLKWTGSIVDWVELVYALHATGSINHGKIFLKELFAAMGELFDFEVKEFSNYFMNLKGRKDGKRTQFLNELAAVLLRKMEESDRRPSRK